ncbi:lipocalin family protein [Pontibacter populi]|uniref:Lipocalin family protein n=1 Tax=Pontibacter populi TaxID=890055 RepID=A0ABV1RRY4_9BACT
MKKLQFLTYLFAVLFTVTMVSCDDDDDDNDVDPGKEAMLTAGVWTGDKIYYQGADFTEQLSGFLDIKSATVDFNADGTYTGNLDGDSESGTWEFTNNETQIIMDADTDDEIIVDINRLTATELWVEGDYMGTGEETIELRFKK